jgi:hypothetical protein
MSKSTLPRAPACGLIDMSRSSLQRVANAVRRRARADGYVVPRQVREELTAAGLADSQWKQVLALIGPSLSYRHGRYYYVPAGPTRMKVRVHRDQRHQQQIDRAVRRLIRQQRAAEAVMVERRNAKRISFVQPAEVQTADQRIQHHLTREISVTGIRLIGGCALRGQKVRVWVPRPSGEESQERYGFVVHILWSAAVGDGLFENGGVFLEMLGEMGPLKLV